MASSASSKRRRNHCMVADCSWDGKADDVFDHFERAHKQYLVDLKNKPYFEFKLEQLQPSTYMLLGENDVYWFILKESRDPETSEKNLVGGLFLYDDSNPTNYTLKIGDGSDAIIDINGPHYCSQGPTANDYPIEITTQELEDAKHWSSGVCKLILGPFVEDEEIIWEYDFGDIDWTDEMEIELNKQYVEMFTCPVCTEYMRGAIHSCENKHLLCGDCLAQLQSQKCPVCRGAYLYDSRQPSMEQLAKVMKFPDHDVYLEKLRKLYAERPLLKL